MAPAMIDVTSSPEPDDSPEALARSSLSTFQPRKEKPNGDLKHPTQLVQEQGNLHSSVTQKAALAGPQPSKKRLKGNKEGFGDEDGRRNGHRASTGSSLPSRAMLQLSASGARREIANARHERRRIGAGGVQEGSLASLLQKSSQNSPASGTGSGPGQRQITATPERASNYGRTQDNENERLKMLGAFQRVPSKSKPQPQMVPREKTAETTPTKPRPLSAPNKPIRETIDLETGSLIRNRQDIKEARSTKPVSHHDTDSLRPVKRRRTNDSKTSTIQVQHPLQRRLEERSRTPPSAESLDRMQIRSASPSVKLPAMSLQTPNEQIESAETSIQASSRTSMNDDQPAISPLKSNGAVLSQAPETPNSYQEEISERAISPRIRPALNELSRHSQLTANVSRGSKYAPEKSISSTSVPISVLGSSEAQVEPPDTSLEFIPLVDSEFSSTSSVTDSLGGNLEQTQIPSNSIRPDGRILHDGSTYIAQVRVVDTDALQLQDAAVKPENSKDKVQPANLPPVVPKPEEISKNHGAPGGIYSPEEDALLVKLKEVDGLPWNKIVPYFNRSFGSLQVRYSTKLKGRKNQAEPAKDKIARRAQPPIPTGRTVTRSVSPDSDALVRRPRKRRNNEAAATTGFISWVEIKRRQLVEDADAGATRDISPNRLKEYKPTFDGERAYPKSMLRILRQREIGSNTGRSWTPMRRSISDELKERVLDDIGPLKYFKGTSGDVTCLAWAPDGQSFAAGSIAISDERSMQYNRPCNLLVGHKERSLLKELPEHHIRRPRVDAGDGNVNGLHSMQETQDPRLFMTVASVQFSPDAKTLYSAGSDRKVRAYAIRSSDVSSVYEIQHTAPLDLLSVSNFNVLATACHQSGDSIGVYQGSKRLLSLSPNRVNFPSALKWGTAYHHGNLLLAGFSVDSINEEQNIAGETALWDIRTETRISLAGTSRNVFDVAWNPSPSAGSSIFAVACSAGIDKASKETRSVVQCFAPSQNRAKKVFEWECPAIDINDVIYCQHDTNLIAAGATDGKVYVWDHRFIKKSNGPLHTLQHGNTLNVLDQDRDREVADTGVRFLSWGATSTRLFTGSSDGVVKVWNPYRSSEDAHLKDIATFDSAIMSGAFGPDYCDLLIGEDQGRINLLSVGYDHKAVRSMQRFELQSAPAPVIQGDDPFAAARELRSSGQIAIRSMGDLPKRQAVQGPNYCGPYLRPSEEQIKTATNEYQFSLDAQNEADSRKASSLSQSDENDQRAQQADKRVQAAQFELNRLQRRLDESLLLEPRAQQNQKILLHATGRRRVLEITHSFEACKLDCDYLPASTDDGEAADSQRSELRIPGALRALKPVASLEMSKEEIMEAGLTAKCISCLGAARKASPGKQTLCERCHLARIAFSASCELCSNPIRLSTKVSDSQKLCERCSFACFRCGSAILIGRDVSLIICNRCELSWQAGVLGYELVGGRGSDLKVRQRLKEREGDDSTEEHLGDREITYYASSWNT